MRAHVHAHKGLEDGEQVLHEEKKQEEETKRGTAVKMPGEPGRPVDKRVVLIEDFSSAHVGLGRKAGESVSSERRELDRGISEGLDAPPEPLRASGSDGGFRGLEVLRAEVLRKTSPRGSERF